MEQVNGRLEFTENERARAGCDHDHTGRTRDLECHDAARRHRRASIWPAASTWTPFAAAATWPLVQALQGSTDWKAAITLRKRAADFVLDSTLQGVASELPAPLAKAAADSLPLRLERQLVSGQQERLSLSLGNIVSAQLQRRKDGAQYVDRARHRQPGRHRGGARAQRHVGERQPQESRSRPVARADRKRAPAGGNRYQLAGLDVKFGTLELFGRRFNDLAINGSAAGRRLAGGARRARDRRER